MKDYWRNTMKIQIVEDNADLRGLYELLFKNAGHEVKTSDNGLNAVTEIADFQPDTVLLDIMMPEMDGYKFLETLANNTSLDPIIIVCSNLTEQADIDRAIAHGADFYLRKSDYIGEELVKAVMAAYDSLKDSHQKPHTPTPAY